MYTASLGVVSSTSCQNLRNAKAAGLSVSQSALDACDNADAAGGTAAYNYKQYGVLKQGALVRSNIIEEAGQAQLFLQPQPWYMNKTIWLLAGAAVVGVWLLK